LFEEELDEHIYTPNTESQLYAFGEGMVKVTNLFILAEEEPQHI